MRIAWIGPWSQQSAIAAFGLAVVEELETRGCEVTIYRSETGKLRAIPPLPGDRVVKDLAGAHQGKLRYGFDHVIANIGDHFGFHGAIRRNLPELGATIIFHDGFIANLAAGYLRALGEPLETDKALVRLTYGDAAVPGKVNVWDAPLETVAGERPMTEWLAPLAAGCVTHSVLWADRLQAACAGPVAIIPLCYPDLGVPAPRPILETLTISTVGYVNPNKRADQVLQALASDSMLAARCRYQLLGEITETQRTRLVSLAASLGVPAPHFAGRLSDDDMRAALAETDVIACLRHPVLESGSASLIIGLFSARPTLVSDQAHYAEIPQGLVLPCTPGDEAADVARHLRWILANPQAAGAMGRRARSYALDTHTAARYAERLLDLAARATEISSVVVAAVRLGRTLGDIGADPQHPAGKRLARLLAAGLPDRR